jgi:hypothetical protein
LADPFLLLERFFPLLFFPVLRAVLFAIIAPVAAVWRAKPAKQRP